MEDPITIGLIGFGAIGQAVARAVVCGEAGNTRLASVLCRNPDKHALALPFAGSVPITVTADGDAFFGVAPGLVIEAAGQDALRQYGVRAIESGADLLATSIGAFADDLYFSSLTGLAQRLGRRVLLASGALPALDWMQSAALSGNCSAAITQTKPAASWRGTPAEALVDLDHLTEPRCFFQGNAREAAQRFPKSSNITAMLALATAGLDATTVCLIAAPDPGEMHTSIDFDSTAGSLKLDWRGVPSVLNPKTSTDVPLNVIKALKNLYGPVCYGP